MTLPPAVAEGIRRFNAGDWFEAHEAFEDGWRAEADPARRRLWQGLVQAAVGLAHRGRGNRRGAAALLERALDKLEPNRPVAAGLDLDALCAELAGCRAALERPDQGDPVPRIRRVGEPGGGVLS